MKEPVDEKKTVDKKKLSMERPVHGKTCRWKEPVDEKNLLMKITCEHEYGKELYQFSFMKQLRVQN